ncbi:unnamed protein product [Trichobilharzia szidati]|nr:unnamed protein product [Trichobilharzia szidati]
MNKMCFTSSKFSPLSTTLHTRLVRLCAMWYVLVSFYFADIGSHPLSERQHLNFKWNGFTFVDKDLAKSIICSPQANQDVCSRLEKLLDISKFLSMEALSEFFCYANPCVQIPSPSSTALNLPPKEKRSLCNIDGCYSDDYQGTKGLTA